MDPKNPGAVDEIVHLGDFWDVEKMEDNKDQIIKINKKVGKYFSRAYKYLKASRSIYESIVERNSEAMNFGKVNVLTYELINELFVDVPVSKKTGKQRHLFGSAYTPKGWVEHTDTILDDIGRVYYLEGDIGTGKSTLLNKICDEGLVSGYDIEVYHTPLVPEKIETIIIKELNVALTTSTLFRNDNYKTIDLNNNLNNDKIDEYRKEILYDKKVYNNLIEEAIYNINKAKNYHDKLEQYYIPNMDFEKVDELKDKIVKKFLNYKV